MADFIQTSQGRLGYGLVQGFRPAAVYQKRDVVHYGGSAYAVLRDGVTGVTPSDDGVDYRLFVAGGQDGANNARWWAGTAVTGQGTGIVAGVPGSNAGDMYANSDTGDLYIATAADRWDFVRNIDGAAGPAGTVGPAGVPGADGLTTSVNGVTQVDGEITLTAGDIPAGSGDVQAALDGLNTLVNGKMGMVKLWEGTWGAAGAANLTVPNLSSYTEIAFVARSYFHIVKKATPMMFTSAFIGSSGATVYQTFFRLKYSGNTLTVEQSKSAHATVISVADNTESIITEIWGVMK